MTKLEVFRPVGNIFLGSFIDLMAVLFVIQVCLEGSAQEITSSVCVALVAVALSWLVFLRPRLVFNEATLEIVNPLQTIVVGYFDITDFNTRYNLTVKVAGRKFAVWVAPAPTRYSSRGIGKQDVRGLGIEVAGTIRAADSPNSASGVAAHLLRTNISAAEAAKTKGKRDTRVHVRYNSVGFVAVLVPSVAFVLAQLLFH